LEREVEWESLEVPLDSLNERSALDQMETREIVIENYFLTSKNEYRPLDALRGYF
jgi:hypothetical protein